MLLNYCQMLVKRPIYFYSVVIFFLKSYFFVEHILNKFIQDFDFEYLYLNAQKDTKPCYIFFLSNSHEYFSTWSILNRQKV